MGDQPCQEWDEKMGNFENLSADEVRALAKHLEGCKACQKAAKFYAGLPDLIHRALKLKHNPGPIDFRGQDK